MGWFIAVLLVVALIYFVARGKSTSNAGHSPRPAREARRTPVYTTPRSASTESSVGREMPFAAPGMKGRLFTYGGPRVRGGVEHVGPYAVMDLETTGLSARRDRVVEVAVARVDATGRIEDEFATLINPDGRDVGPTFIHGITNQHVKSAPTFAEVIPELLERMSGAVIVAHNATFEEAFLAQEFVRAGVSVDQMPALCTLWLGRQTFTTPNHKLGTLARAGGVPLVDKHAALGDVRAVAALLPHMTRRLGAPVLYSCNPMSFRGVPSSRRPRLVTRAVALRKGTDGWMQSLVARLPSDGMPVDDAAAAAYLDALGEVLCDGRLTGNEAKLLAGLAGSAGMGGEQVSALNRQFLDLMKQAALDDEILTATELRQLRATAKALSLPDHFGDLIPTAPEPPTGPTASEDGPVIHTAVSETGSRTERAQHALALQRAGHSRAETAARLAVSQDTVKGLLRDAKFFENPESDPARLDLARLALVTRNTGSTRERFQADHGLTVGKSTESWRDAGALSSLLGGLG